jgi:hypothetical protein
MGVAVASDTRANIAKAAAIKSRFILPPSRRECSAGTGRSRPAQGLWVTDGTVAGTHELAGIKGAYSGGLAPSDFTVISNNEVLFNGVDASGNHTLWVTNGTAAGTHEVMGISGAFTGNNGPLGQPGGLNPGSLAVVSLPAASGSVTSSDPNGAIGTFSAQSDGNGGTVVSDPPGNTVAVSHAQDAFVFSPNLGESTVANVNAHNDTLDPAHSEFADFAALLAHEHQEGAHPIAHEATNIAHIGAVLSAHVHNFLV